MSDIYRELLWLFGIGLVTENKAMFYSKKWLELAIYFKNLIEEVNCN